MKTGDVRNPNSFFNFILLCICYLPWTACNPAPETSFPLTPLPEINGEAISFLGDTLGHPTMDVGTLLQSDSLLRESSDDYHADSTDLEAIIWYGRRLAYANRYRDAIDVFTRGMASHPRSPELYRHRGHRFITLRQPENAIHDLEIASTLIKDRTIEIEPDVTPNELNIPLSNLQFNIYYHLGLAWYLREDYSKAVEAFLSSMQYAENPDLRISASYWMYLSYLRMGDKTSADKILDPVNIDMEIIDNDGYLHQLLVFKGTESPPSSSDTNLTPGILVNQYGMSCWFDANGREAEAASLRKLILSTDLWPAFGYLAAEADSARQLKK